MNNYIKNLGIPYMGSKRKLAPKIVDYILDHNPNCKYFYDLFGGGGSMSFEALQRRQIKQVFYNELNTGVVNLLKDIRDSGVRDEYYDWISREDFMKYKDLDTWKAGLVKTCWSFGNSQKGYLFGKDIEHNKKVLHELIISRSNSSIKDVERLFKIAIPSYLLEHSNITTRRLAITGYIKKCIDNRLDNEPLERLQYLESLERLESLENLGITNLSYCDVDIATPIEETIIYLDPPYANTGTYQLEIDHDELMHYIKNSPYKIYVSSYEFDLPCVYEMEHRSLLSATTNNKVVEKLFCNREENKTLMEDLLGF